MVMDLEDEVSQILKDHEKLRSQLIEIPKTRFLTYREDFTEDGIIGKPRFDPPIYLWDPELLTQLKNHLQRIWNLFARHSYWFDDNLKEILLQDRRRLSKKSVLFLLEHDVWETDKVYGAYLTENFKDKTEISYYRFYYKFKTFSFSKMDKKTREKWICNDAINQILKQFQLIWKLVENEILSCLAEEFLPPIPHKITDKYLFIQYEMCQKLFSISKEASLLILGRLEELYLLRAMKISRTPKNKYLLPLAELNGIIDKSNKRLFSQIRSNYNLLKHLTTYDINRCDVDNFIKQFGKYVNPD